MLVHAILPPAAVDDVDILPVASAAFAQDAIADRLPVLQVAHGGAQRGDFLFKVHLQLSLSVLRHQLHLHHFAIWPHRAVMFLDQADGVAVAGEELQFVGLADVEHRRV